MNGRKLRNLFGCLLVLVVAGCPRGGQQAPTAGTPEVEARPLVGLASFTAEMLRRGAGERSTEEIAQAIEFVGGHLSVDAGTDYTTLDIRVLREHLDLALELMADLAQNPQFPEEELEKQRRRELDRLALMQSRPRWLARQAFYRALYGETHPYGHADSLAESVQRVTRDDVVQFHQAHYVPRNAFLLVVGSADAGEVRGKVERFFGGWADRQPVAQEISPPSPGERDIVVVHLPGATQAQIVVGNLALARRDPDYLSLRLANQVLGGSASARLFMNLRERCSYSYGVYSHVASLAGAAPFVVGGAVEARHTAGALREIFTELGRIRDQEAPPQELGPAREYLVGSFPAMTETAGNIAELYTIQRALGLPSDYWSAYRSRLGSVESGAALAAAREYVRPDEATLVIVGDAEVVAPAARAYGSVQVVAADGTLIERLEGHQAGEGPAPAPPCPAATPRPGDRAAEPPAGATPRDMAFPAAQEEVLPNGLSLATIEMGQLPLVHLRLVVRAGRAADLSGQEVLLTVSD